MLADLTLKLDSHGIPVTYHNSSNLHGVLMENIDPDYANVLHQSTRHPYSMAVPDPSAYEWHIRTLTDEAYEKIILPLMKSSFSSFVFKSSVHVDITEKALKTLEHRALMNEFSGVPCDNRFQIRFITPTSFKVQGRYWNMPDIRLILRSLMHKYAEEDIAGAADEDILSQLTETYEPNRYSLNSTVFPLEGIVIPSFVGSLSFRIRGKETLARYVRLLLRFGEFSGVGIKCGIGMGNISYQGGGQNHAHGSGYPERNDYGQRGDAAGQ